MRRLDRVFLAPGSVGTRLIQMGPKRVQSVSFYLSKRLFGLKDENEIFFGTF